MAGETINKAKMADKLAEDLFGEFLWERIGPANQNWECVDAAHQKATHPSDVVFYYDEPYSVTRRYITADLKSYALGSITPFAVKTAAMKLATSLACAENSASFQKKYFHPSITAKVSGMLFIYNHDGKMADHGFSPWIAGIDCEAIAIPPGSKLAVFGPTDIFWLNNVARDIVYMRGKSQLPMKDRCNFYYPNLVRHPKLQPTKARAATLEMLTSSWIILEYQPAGPIKRGYVIYYRGKGEKHQEFVFLLDYIQRFQLLAEDSAVTVKLIDADTHASANWGIAVDEYIGAQDGGEDLKSMLAQIRFEEATNLEIRFSEMNIGMQDA